MRDETSHKVCVSGNVKRGVPVEEINGIDDGGKRIRNHGTNKGVIV